jgi:hypothetical protein
VGGPCTRISTDIKHPHLAVGLNEFNKRSEALHTPMSKYMFIKIVDVHGEEAYQFTCYAKSVELRS